MIVPEIVADSVIGEVERFVERSFTPKDRDTWESELVTRAHTVYTANKTWARKLRGRNGREVLYSFMRHWLAAILHKHTPGIYRVLPKSFANGQPLRRG